MGSINDGNNLLNAGILLQTSATGQNPISMPAAAIGPATPMGAPGFMGMGDATNPYEYVTPFRGQMMAAGFMPPGGGGGGDSGVGRDFVRGMHGLLREQRVVTQETSNIARNVAALAEKTARYSGTRSEHMASGAATLSVASPLSEKGSIQHASTGDQNIMADQSKMEPGHSSAYVNPQNKRSGIVNDPRHVGLLDRKTAVDPSTGLIHQAPLTLGQVQENAAQKAAAHLSQWNFKGIQVAGRSHEGGPLDYIKDGMVHAAPAGSREERKVLRDQKITEHSKNLVQRLGKGEDLGDSIKNEIPGAAAVAGVVGVVGSKVMSGTNFMENQRAQNAEYQSMTGGSNVDAFGERFSEKIFAWSRKGLMGEDQAEQLYKGAASLRGDEQLRQAIQNFGTNTYAQYGMQVGESLKLVEDAMKAGVHNLNALNDALRGVSDAARSAGMNASQARGLFEQAVGHEVGTFGPEAGIASAKAMAIRQTNMGDLGKDFNFASLSSNRNLLNTASQLGMTRNQLIAQSSTMRGQAALKTQQQDLAKTNLQGLITAQGKALIQKWIQDEHIMENGGLTFERAMEGAVKLMASGEVLDAEIVFQTMQAFGVPVPPDIEGNQQKVIAFLITTLFTNNAFGAKEATAEALASERGDVGAKAAGQSDIVKAPGGTDLSGPSRRSNDRTAVGAAADKIMHEADPRNKAIREREKAMGVNDEDLGKDLPTGKFLTPKDRARNLYFDDLQNNKDQDFSRSAEELVGSGFDENRRFRVSTKDGWKNVNTEDLIRYYKDQLSTGNVMVTEGLGAGKTTSEIFGVKSQGKVEDAESAKKGAQGDSATSTDGKPKSDPNYTTGNITIEAKGKLKEFLETNFTPGSQGVGTNQFEGTAPSSSANPNQLPTGG